MFRWLHRLFRRTSSEHVPEPPDGGVQTLSLPHPAEEQTAVVVANPTSAPVQPDDAGHAPEAVVDVQAVTVEAGDTTGAEPLRPVEDRLLPESAGGAALPAAASIEAAQPLAESREAAVAEPKQMAEGKVPLELAAADAVLFPPATIERAEPPVEFAEHSAPKLAAAEAVLLPRARTDPAQSLAEFAKASIAEPQPTAEHEPPKPAAAEAVPLPPATTDPAQPLPEFAGASIAEPQPTAEHEPPKPAAAEAALLPPATTDPAQPVAEFAGAYIAKPHRTAEHEPPLPRARTEHDKPPAELVEPTVTEPLRVPPQSQSKELQRRLSSPSARKSYFGPAFGQSMPQPHVLISPEFAFRLLRQATQSRLTAVPELEAPELKPALEHDSSAAPLPKKPPLHRFVASTDSLPPGSPGTVAFLYPAAASSFFLSPETDPAVSPRISRQLLLEPTLLNSAIRLRKDVLRLWQSGHAPLTPDQFFQVSLGICGHAGTALLLCHNVARSFSRGGAALRWMKTDRSRAVYSDGVQTYTAAVIHPKGLIRPTPAASVSIFYLLFAPRAIGVGDPGHWYRFFGVAAAAWYAASGATVADPLDTLLAGSTVLPRMDWLNAALPHIPDEIGAPGTAWLWANALSFCEAATWARNQDQIAASASISRSGARFGISKALPGSAGPRFAWYLPRAGSLRDTIPPPDRFDESVAATLAPDDD